MLLLPLGQRVRISARFSIKVAELSHQMVLVNQPLTFLSISSSEA